MNISQLCDASILGRELSLEEAIDLWYKAPLGLLMHAANQRREQLHPENRVGWIIDRNVNYSNICNSGCKFCNFYRSKKHSEAYITSLDEYKCKIDEMIKKGGRQLLLQGGMHPDFDIHFYEELFRSLKSEYPQVKLHALGPPEIVSISKNSNLNYTQVLEKLIEAGLDSLPGAGAEILSDRVRSYVSPAKCTTAEWLNVMRAAHQLGMYTSATMMFGHIETIEERIQHLFLLREVQSEKPQYAPGFISFIPWPFQDEDTHLKKKSGVINRTTASDYIRLISLSRLVLNNIRNIQASWLTVGKEVAQVCLHAGANDFGSIMIEENVVSVAGAKNQFDADGIQKAIAEAGFIPFQRNQRFEAENE